MSCGVDSSPTVSGSRQHVAFGFCTYMWLWVCLEPTSLLACCTHSQVLHAVFTSPMMEQYEPYLARLVECLEVRRQHKYDFPDWAQLCPRTNGEMCRVCVILVVEEHSSHVQVERSVANCGHRIDSAVLSLAQRTCCSSGPRIPRVYKEMSAV